LSYKESTIIVIVLFNRQTMTSTLLLSITMLIVVFSHASSETIDLTNCEQQRCDKSVLAPFREALEAPEAQQYRHPGDSEKRKNIVFLKTHKTGSGTMASFLFRFASRHHSRFFIASDSTDKRASTMSKKIFQSWAAHHKSLPKAKANTLLRHVAYHSEPPPLPLPKLIEFYQYIIDKPFIVTLVREPMQHVISYMYWYERPKVEKLGLTEAIKQRLPTSPQCRELGITTDEQLDLFIESGMYLFDMICLTEHFDECSVMLRRRMNWDLLDITYLRVHDADEDVIMFETIDLCFALFF
jgi:hypothetical protein